MLIHYRFLNNLVKVQIKIFIKTFGYSKSIIHLVVLFQINSWFKFY